MTQADHPFDRWFHVAFYDNPLMRLMSPFRRSVVEALGFFAPIVIIVAMGLIIDSVHIYDLARRLYSNPSHWQADRAVFLTLLFITLLPSLVFLLVAAYYWLIYGRRLILRIPLPPTNQLTPPEIHLAPHVWIAPIYALGTAIAGVIVFRWTYNLVWGYANIAGAATLAFSINAISLAGAALVVVMCLAQYVIVQILFPMKRGFNPWKMGAAISCTCLVTWCIVKVFHSILLHYTDIFTICFVGETPVKTTNGLKLIEQIKPEESLTAKHLWTGEFIPSAVGSVTSGVVYSVVEVCLSNDETITCTPEHRWRVWGLGWVAGKRLRTGDTLIGLNGNLPKVRSVTPRKCAGGQLVHTIEVRGSKTFFIGRSLVLVHNKSIK